MKKIFFYSLTLCSCLGFSYANHCSELEIQISNNTAENCLLGYHNLVHGYYLDKHKTAPTLIWPMHTEKFDLRQSELYGPDIELEYICGTGKVKIESKQGMCLVRADSVTTTIKEHHDIAAYASTVDASRWNNNHGVAKWIFSAAK